MSAQDFSRERFSFVSDALPEDHALLVLRFFGTEGLNELYSFTISLATQKESLPLEAMLAQKARFVIRASAESGSKDAIFSGYIGSITQTARYNDWSFYEVTLHPGLWYYTKSVQNNFFVDKDVHEILEQCLKKMESCCPKHDFRLAQTYPKQSFSMQNNESLYDYMACKMEHDGLYYYFEETDEGEQLVITDSRLTHVSVKGPNPLRYSPGSGLEGLHREEVIPSFSLTCSPLPRQVILREYDWLNPNRPLVGKSLVSATGMGDVYYYGEGFTSTSEGNRLAELRAESLRCQGRICQGTSANPHLRPGFCFSLEGHYDPSLNREYLLTQVRHEGSQEAWISQAIGVPIDNADRLYYRNSFSCIASDVQFRPLCKTERKKISGMITAFIDSASDSAVAEVNETGCYKVVFPQDISDHASGRSSCWVRRMQPHVGKGHGFSFPLTPGVEVLIAFVDGNPDRPVIAGALSNAESGFMENPSTAQAAAIQTAGGNGLAFNDVGTKQGLVLGTGGRSALMMSSGSTDALLEFSDSAFESFTSSALIEAGISHNLEAGFRQVIKADHGVFDNMRTNILRGSMQAANLLEWGAQYVEHKEQVQEEREQKEKNEEKTQEGSETESGKDTATGSEKEKDKEAEKKTTEEKEAQEKKNTNILDGLSYTASTLKSIIQSIFTHDMLKEFAEAQYSTVLTSGDEASELQLNTSVKQADINKYMGFWILQVLPKFAGSIPAVIFGETDEHDVNKKRALGREYAAATAESLIAEVTALVLLFATLRKKEPKGMLIKSENGPLVSSAKEKAIHLAEEGMTFASFPNVNKKLSLPPNEFTNLAQTSEILLSSQKVKEIASHDINLLSFREITANSPKIVLSSKREDVGVAEIDRLGPQLPDIGNGSQKYPLDNSSTASISMESTTQSSKLTIENKNGPMTLDNEGTMILKNKGNLLMENQANQNNSLIVRYKASAGGKQFSLIMNDNTCNLCNENNHGFSLEKDETISIKNSQQSITMNKSGNMNAKAQTITLEGTNKVCIKCGSGTINIAEGEITFSLANKKSITCSNIITKIG